jgi:hypothetical protein
MLVEHVSMTKHRHVRGTDGTPPTQLMGFKVIYVGHDLKRKWKFDTKRI